MSFLRTSVSNGVGEIVLDRPKALNALDQTMIDDMFETLQQWGDDDAVELVLVTSASPRAFCAGGDIRAIRENVIDGDTEAITRYFSSEYRLNQLIAEYPKPYVSLIDGAAMGGGLGISVHGEIRVVTENALIAMPETAIGFFPDVGATYFLPRLPEGVGMWLGLTGARLRGADALAVGLATHYCAADQLPALAETIRSGAGLAAALKGLPPAPASELPLDKIAGYFETSTPPSSIIGGLTGSSDEWAQEMLDLLSVASPTSIAVTGELIAAGEHSSLAECLERELHAAEQITQHPDFAEGVRAVLVDKDRSPAFEPDELDEVDAAVVRRIVGTR